MSSDFYKPVANGVYEHKGSVISVGYGLNLAISEKKPRMRIWVGELPAGWRLCQLVPLPGPDWSQAPAWAQSLPMEARVESKRWLTARGLRSMDDGEVTL